MSNACETQRMQNRSAARSCASIICACCISLCRWKTAARACAARPLSGNAPQERQREILQFITEHGERLARVATSGLPLTDDLKARILSTFLTLMNLRENLDRANMRSSFGRSGQLR